MNFFKAVFSASVHRQRVLSHTPPKYRGRPIENCSAIVRFFMFRVLTIRTDDRRLRSIMEALRRLHVPHSPGAPLFFFATREGLRMADPLALDWHDGNGRDVCLV